MEPLKGNHKESHSKQLVGSNEVNVKRIPGGKPPQKTSKNNVKVQGKVNPIRTPSSKQLSQSKKAPRGDGPSIAPSISAATSVGKQVPNLNILRKQNYIFVSHSTADLSFLENSGKFDLFDETGRRIFYCKLMEGDRRRLSLGTEACLEVIYCILDLEGHELVRLQGFRGTNKLKAVYTVYRSGKRLADVIQINKPSVKDVQFQVTDATGKAFAVIEVNENYKSSKCCRCLCCCKGQKSTGSKNLVCDINLPNGRHRIGSLGKIMVVKDDPIFQENHPDIAPQLKNSFGIELAKNLEFNDKIILLSCLFIFDIPKSYLASTMRVD